jgi:hypothetical protein
MAFHLVACGRCFFTTTLGGRSANFLIVALLSVGEYTQDGMPDRVKIR